METIRANGIELAYLERGSGSETVVFSHSYLVDHSHFGAQIEELSRRFRVIAFDHRDHGRSERVERAYDMDDLVADAGALIEALDAAPCHFVGLSTGGFVGMRLALRSPTLLRSLVLMATSAEREPARARIKYELMFQVLRAFGFGPLMGSVMSLMFSPATLGDPARRDETRRWAELMRANDREALIRFGRAIFGRDDLTAELHRIETPTLVVTGADDRPQPPQRGERIAAGIAGARFRVIPNAGHLSTLDAPDAVTDVLARFLESQTARPGSNTG